MTIMKLIYLIVSLTVVYRQTDDHDTGLHAHRIRRDLLVTGPGRPLNATIEEADLPGVQRADHRGAGHDPVREWTTLVRTPVVDREKAIAQIEDRNLAIGDADRTAFAPRDVLTRGDAYPAEVLGRLRAAPTIEAPTIDFGHARTHSSG
jgi:hypothetical protein